MNSIFSSFDAVLGEYFGQKINSINSMNSSFRFEKKGSDAAEAEQRKGFLRRAVEEMKRKDGVPAAPARKDGSPRFAVELDGLHCFETIVSH